jgi:hypothetical protein
MSGCFSEAEELPANISQEGWIAGPLVKKAIAGLPQPHDVRTREHFEQCYECRAWRHAVEASFELPIPEHRQTHKSHEEFLACDICQGWERRRDAILEKALGSKADWI